MKNIIIILSIFIALIGCNDEIIVKNTPENVFQAFWKTMDEQYVYFEEKKIDWDSIYNLYYPKAVMAKNEDDLYEIFKEIIPLFKDGHLSIFRSSQVCVTYFPQSYFHYPNPEPWKYGLDSLASCNYPSYLSYQHKTKKHAYIQCEDPKNELIESIILNNLKTLNYNNGLIVDLRNHAGGSIKSCFDMASMFYIGDKTLLYAKPKNSTKRNDFGKPIAINYMGIGIVSNQIPIIVLTGTVTYSAGNILAYILSELPNCIIVGKPTGGGGSPMAQQYLPNGWILRNPYCKYFTVSGENMEFGLKPDFVLDYNPYGEPSDTIDKHLVKAFELLDSINGSIK
jgi:hypothetical protein